MFVSWGTSSAVAWFDSSPTQPVTTSSGSSVSTTAARYAAFRQSQPSKQLPGCAAQSLPHPQICPGSTSTRSPRSTTTAIPLAPSPNASGNSSHTFTTNRQVSHRSFFPEQHCLQPSARIDDCRRTVGYYTAARARTTAKLRLAKRRCIHQRNTLLQPQTINGQQQDQQQEQRVHLSADG